MKLKAKVDILVDSKKYEAGSVFEASADHGRTLVELGWVEVVEEARKAPKKTTKKK